jgi:hypothetical protein
MLLAVSTVAVAIAPVAILLGVVGMRLFGGWLIRRGGSIEARGHGPLPSGYLDPGKPRRGDDPAPVAKVVEAERRDPFDAG